MTSTAQLVDNTKGRNMNYIHLNKNWITRRISKNFINSYWSFINLINFSHQSFRILQKNWRLYIKRKNICHQQRQSNIANLACFNAITTLYLVRNIIWRTKYSMEALYHCAKIAQSLQCNMRPLFALGLFCFHLRLNVFNLSA